MGFKLFGSDSNSSVQNITETNTDFVTKNSNVSGNSGVTVAGGEGGGAQIVTNNLQTTDFGAIGASFGFASDVNANVLNYARNVQGDVLSAYNGATGLAGHALDLTDAVNNRSLSYASDIFSAANKSVSNYAGQALTAVKESADRSVTVAQTLATMFGTTVKDFAQQDQTQLGNVVSALASSYESRNTSANTQILGAQTDLVKYIGFAVVGIAALYFLTRRG